MEQFSYVCINLYILYFISDFNLFILLLTLLIKALYKIIVFLFVGVKFYIRSNVLITWVCVCVWLCRGLHYQHG